MAKGHLKLATEETYRTGETRHELLATFLVELWEELLPATISGNTHGVLPTRENHLSLGI